jgi:hypothetical protein
MIKKFCEMEHPKALAVREAIKLAAAAKELGWADFVLKARRAGG